MEKYVIHGNKKLIGSVEIAGAKNAAVAVIPATLLADGPCIIENLPNISDVKLMLEILYTMGATVRYIDSSTVEINCDGVRTFEAPPDLPAKMRASCYLIGALLGRCGKCAVPMPGGCDFGVRPIDQHLKGFTLLGAEIQADGGCIVASVDKLIGTSIYLDMASVGATINIMLAAAKAEGQTIIENAAKEPHIVDLANFLNTMGADVKGAGTDVIKINGVPKLFGATYTIIPDQIEAGTYMVAAAATLGDVTIKNVIPKHLECITAKLIEAGVGVEEYDDAVRVFYKNPLTKTNIKTYYYPGFPTDMQPQFTTLLSIAKGTSIVTEGVYDHRFRYVGELNKMGAEIQVDGKVAVVEGVSSLMGAPVSSCDLRAGAALVIAGLIAEGRTEVLDIHYIERGYENLVEKLRSLGADIKKVSIPDGSVIKDVI
ncbi:MAG: UDP-N-acetylglucosamine 1-carboxyvinyltransferase [Clostridia bacterium]|nr:UDP-N-acetylglucosamine 1-carboxyvinyltransferase [Clostridia bacterium]